MDPRLLSLKDAATYLGLTPWQVRRLVWSHAIPSLRVNGKIYLDRRDLDEFPDRAKRR